MKKILIFLVGILLLSSQAFATPISRTNLMPFTGTSAAEGTALETNGTMYLLAEATNYTVGSSGLRVDLLPPLVTTLYGPGNALNTDPTSGTPYYISAGTVINSYFIHFDPFDPSGNSLVRLTASLQFNSTEKILGIMTNVVSLDASDPLVGLATITYNSQPLQGWGLDKQSDTLNWALNADGSTTLTLDLYVGRNTLDEVRVITSGAAPIPVPAAPVPEPATMLLLGSGLIGLAGFGRRKFFKKA